MNYLIGLLVVGMTMVVFLRILAVFESGAWPSERAKTPAAALRELLLGRRATK